MKRQQNGNQNIIIKYVITHFSSDNDKVPGNQILHWSLELFPAVTLLVREFYSHIWKVGSSNACCNTSNSCN